MELEVGSILTGKVVTITKFGAFVSVAPNKSGLVHISEISTRFVKHPSEAVKVGDVVDVLVLGVDVPKKRISLSIKQAAKKNPSQN